MWYDRPKARLMVFFGAALVLMGVGAWSMDHVLPGVILMIIGVSLVVIGFTIVKLHLMLALKKK